MVKLDEGYKKSRLIRNMIRCVKCGDIIESKSIHDFKSCSCGAVFVDGGLEYQRIGGNRENWENLAEYEIIEEKEN